MIFAIYKCSRICLSLIYEFNKFMLCHFKKKKKKKQAPCWIESLLYYYMHYSAVTKHSFFSATLYFVIHDFCRNFWNALPYATKDERFKQTTVNNKIMTHKSFFFVLTLIFCKFLFENCCSKASALICIFVCVRMGHVYKQRDTISCKLMMLPKMFSVVKPTKALPSQV